MNLQEVARRIKALRGDRSQLEFSYKLNVSQNYMSQMENAKVKPSIETLFSISQYCDVSIDYILTGRDYTSNGITVNQSFVGVNSMAPRTHLAKNMFKTLDQISRGTQILASGIKDFDSLAVEFSNLKALEGTASALSISSEIQKTLEGIKKEEIKAA